MPPRQIKSLSADVERTLTAVATTTAGSIVGGAREAQTTLVAASTDAANQVKSLAADVERSLSMAGTSTAKSITAGARDAQITLVAASSEAAEGVKSLAVEHLNGRFPRREIGGSDSMVKTGSATLQATLVTVSSDAAAHVQCASSRCRTYARRR